MTDSILTINAGSSSIKIAVFPRNAAAPAIYRGKIEAHGASTAATIQDGGGRAVLKSNEERPFSHAAALAQLVDWLASRTMNLACVGHRVVHGGSAFTAPVRVTAETAAQLEALISLAPLHQPHNLAAIRALSELFPGLPQIASFDTAFHATQPPIATMFALPRRLAEKGVRRYGFHGLSYDFIASELPKHLGERANGRVVVAHLGHGASLCAMRARRSIATTMGFTALDGLVMGTRCGALDPGVILYLMNEEGMSAEDVGRLLYEQSGLLGVSGVSDDMRSLLSSPSPHAAEAVELFVYRIGRELGSLAGALGGLDALVFTGGIGEHSAEIRARVCAQASWLGVQLDEERNRAGEIHLNTEKGAVDILALKTDEESVIARDCRALSAA